MQKLSFYDLYKFAYGKEASDIHLLFGKLPQIRVHGELEDCTDCTEGPLKDEEIESLVSQVLTLKAKDDLSKNNDADFAYAFSTHERLRINVHYERGHLALTARIIKAEIPTFESTGLGETEKMLTNLRHGLILVCGPTGSGKSTTLAAMLDSINEERTCKIITAEDPIEFVFEHKKSTIEQREIGIDAPTFGSALRTVFRQDPNVIMVGEMRDKDTVEQTLRIAETGHLVFSTLHTSSAASTVLRIVDIFEPHEQRQIKTQLAENLRAVIFQQLLPSTDGKRIIAREILINTKAVANIIRSGNFEQIASVMQTGLDEGMTTMSKALERLYKAKKISKETYDKRKEQSLTGYSFR
ncbi:PilT/PilU family type 4a pilus ATPase [Candidatus Uhrbacteria bacterium]|nr:PilT/PilU family type 4a pilus ATPase [Candidatus Uhrbacteria bacterium]